MVKTKIKQIYKTYFQKSKVFLYPGLKHSSKWNIKPLQTYISWTERNITIKDKKLICLFEKSNKSNFKIFEEKFLFKHSLFSEYVDINKKHACYIFDLSIKYNEDFTIFLNSKYSKLSKELKEEIKKYYGEKSANYAYVDTYLKPKKYYDIYANLLCPNKIDVSNMISILSNVEELCTKVDMDLEDFKINEYHKHLKK